MMADSDDKHIPTATEVHNAVCKIRESKPGLGLKKVIFILRDTHGWSINLSRLRKLVAPGDGTNNKNDTPKIVSPTLSGVLSNNNICGLILGPLLTVTDDLDTQPWTSNFQDLRLLHVSRDIRKAAWKFILENNTWVEARFVWDAARLVQPLPSAIYRAMNDDEQVQPALIQDTIVSELFTPDMAKEFQSSVAVTMSIGHTQGQEQQVDGVKSKTLAVFFAFHSQKFDHFIRDLADIVEQWDSMAVEVNHAHIYKFPSTIHIVVDGIIRGLGRIREVNHVTSSSLLKDPIDPMVDFKKIAQAMMSPKEVKSEIRAKLLEFYNHGITSMEEGDYPEAIQAFRRGHEAYETFHESKGLKPKLGSIENNEIELVKADIDSMGAEAVNRTASARSSIWTTGCAGPRLMAREITARELSLAVTFASFPFESPSITDEQRFRGHCRRAVAYSNLGDFITELDTVIPKSEHAALLAGTTPLWNNAGFCYRRAAQDAFHATHLAGTVVPDGPQELVDTMHAVRRRMCDKMGYDADDHLAQMHRFGLARLQLPVLGLWEGDPILLFDKWGSDKMMLLALFRQREGSGGPGIGELKEALARRGLCCKYGKNGEVFLDGKADVQMRPTWVVPDNTRDGLRAAGLSGDKFEMAWR